MDETALVATADETALAKIVEENNLPKATAELALGQFTVFLHHAAKYEAQATAINVTSSDQLEEMAEARKVRLGLKSIRVEAEKRRKCLKAESFRFGKAIDGMANIVKAIIVPLEEHLDRQERFTEIKEAKALRELTEKRRAEIQALGVDPLMYRLGPMTDEEYQAVYNGIIAEKKQREAAEKRAEDDRIAAEKAEEERQRKIQEENDRLKAEAVERDKQAEAERVEREAREKEEREKREAIEAKRNREIEKERRAQEAILKKEREAREAVEAAESARRAEEARKVEEGRKAALKAQRAPDKAKLSQLVIDLAAFPLPTMKTKAGESVIDAVSQDLSKLIAFINQEVGTL